MGAPGSFWYKIWYQKKGEKYEKRGLQKGKGVVLYASCFERSAKHGGQMKREMKKVLDKRMRLC